MVYAKHSGYVFYATLPTAYQGLNRPIEKVYALLEFIFKVRDGWEARRKTHT